MAYESEHVLVSELAIGVRNRIREFCKDLPEAGEKIDGFGHTVFHVRDKSFVMMGEGEKGWGGNLSLKADKETQQMMIDKGPYIRAPYIGQHGWLMVKNADIKDWDEFRELIVEGFLRAAPKKLAQAYHSR